MGNQILISDSKVNWEIRIGYVNKHVFVVASQNQEQGKELWKEKKSNHVIWAFYFYFLLLTVVYPPSFIYLFLLRCRKIWKLYLGEAFLVLF
jgi:hypothetical protein